ncbi:MAG TPA: transaldolase [Longimicrobium sp.]|nr:transaldolase [Longimicrobium sp.]
MADNATSRLHTLHEQGQSVWLDYIRRGIIENGELEGMIRDYDLRGVTSNPSIFEEAIGKSDDYDDELEALAARGTEAGAAFESLAVADIQRACDLFRGVYDAAEGHDGFVSLEVSPLLADDTQRTADEARRLWKLVDRPNLMIKVPGTDEGIAAIEQLLSEGVNVNITLLFSLAGYERVMEAFLRGMERRAEAGQPLERVASVASFFVSRVDGAVDAALEKIVKEGGPNADKAKGVMGRAAIDNAKMAYLRFTQVFSGERWERLKARGARVQRPLWASTSTKNPAYRDVTYIEELIGPDTVNTMPLATIEAFADHGETRRTVDTDLDRARGELATLKELGIDLDRVTDQLQVEGVEKFAKAFNQMIQAVGEKLGRVAQGT